MYTDSNRTTITFILQIKTNGATEHWQRPLSPVREWPFRPQQRRCLPGSHPHPFTLCARLLLFLQWGWVLRCWWVLPKQHFPQTPHRVCIPWLHLPRSENTQRFWSKINLIQVYVFTLWKCFSCFLPLGNSHNLLLSNVSPSGPPAAASHTTEEPALKRPDTTESLNSSMSNGTTDAGRKLLKSSPS